MPAKALSFGVIWLAVVVLAGCGTGSKGTGRGESANQGAAKGDSSKGSTTGEKTPASKGGKDTGPKDREAVADKKDGIPADAATELTCLQHKAFVVFCKGFSEEQMRAFIDHIDKYHGMGTEPRRTYGIFSYQAEIARSNQGMRIVREDGFTKITIPVQTQFRKPKDEGA